MQTLKVANSILAEAECDDTGGTVISQGYNIESPGNTCGFNQVGDQASVSLEELNLQPRADNGGPTETRALGTDSVAIDQIPAEDCVDAESIPPTIDASAPCNGLPGTFVIDGVSE